MSFLEELYYGNLNPNVKCFDKNTEYGKAMNSFSSCEDRLNELLDGKELKIFNDLVNANDKLTAVTDIENFKIGFRLGVQMICDSLIFDNNKIFKDIE